MQSRRRSTAAGEATSPAPLTIHRTVDLDAPPERVWAVVGTRAGLRRWWITAADLVLDERAGGRYDERGEYPGYPYHLTGRVVAYNPPRIIALRFREQFADGTAWPDDTIITMTLSGDRGRTRLVVEHRGFERLPAASRADTCRSYAASWAEVLARLPALVRAPR